jgi:hypothetical protein
MVPHRLALCCLLLHSPSAVLAQTTDTVRFTPTVGYPTFAVREPVLRVRPGTVLISAFSFPGL